MSPDRIEPHQMFAQFIDTIAQPARRIAAAPQDFPRPPDLIAEFERCAFEFGVAAGLLKPNYPACADLYLAAQRRVEATVAKAKEFRR